MRIPNKESVRLRRHEHENGVHHYLFVGVRNKASDEFCWWPFGLVAFLNFDEKSRWLEFAVSPKTVQFARDNRQILRLIMKTFPTRLPD